MLDNSNRVVNGLWIGSQLSLLELMTIKSFIKNGHHFQLWVYEPLETEAIAGLELMDANEIIAKEKVFRYKQKSQNGLGNGSYAGFSDIFRYKLLYEKGGWWVDMDITCLKPLDFNEAFVFRAHFDTPVVGNVMKCKSKSTLMKTCYEQSVATINEHNKDWLKPLKILSQNISDQGYDKFVRNDLAIPDHFGLIRIMLYSYLTLPNQHYFVHWLNEKWIKEKIKKSDFNVFSTYYSLLSQYQLQHQVTLSKRLLSRLSIQKLLAVCYRLTLRFPVVHQLIFKIRGLSGQSHNEMNPQPQILSTDLLIQLGIQKNKSGSISNSNSVS